MSVVRHPLSGSSSSDSTSQDNLVRLSDADRVRDEAGETAFRPGPRDTSSTFVFETNLRGTMGNAPSPDDAAELVAPREDAWSGLDVEQTLGQLMTATRKHSGLSREEVADRTNIPAYYVRMIESDSYDAIPDQLYLLPFFRRYADFLGLDAKKVVSRFICDFEKAENEVVATPAPSAYAKALQKWRQVAAATVIGAILLPCIAWGIGTMRTAYRNRADSSPVVSKPLATQPSTSVASTDVRVPDAVPLPQATVPPATVSTATSGSSAGPRVAPQLHARTKSSRAGRAHRLSRHSRHSRHRGGQFT
jgi:transcriptional regulator with XRE-family HTH domain